MNTRLSSGNTKKLTPSYSREYINNDPTIGLAGEAYTLDYSTDDYYYDGSNVVQCTDNTPRIHSTDGLNIEPAVANLLPFKDWDTNWSWSGDNLQRGGTTYWFLSDGINSSSATFTLDSDSVRSAASARSIKCVVSNDGDAIADIRFRTNATNMPLYVTSGTDYTVSFWVKSSSAITPTINFDISLGANLGLGTTFDATTSWTKVEETFTANATSALGQIFFKLGNIGNITIQIDCISFEEAPFASSRWIGGDAAVGSEEVTDGVFEAVTAGSELMPNQVDRDFSGASAWADNDLNAYDETDDLTITADAEDQYCTLLVASAPTTVGKTYLLQFALANVVSDWDIKSYDGTQTIGNVSTDDTHTIYFTATTTGGLRIVSGAADSSGDFDDFSLKQVTFDSWTDTADGLAPGTSAGSLTNKASWDASQSAESALTQTGTTATANKVYRVSYVVERSAGTVQIEFGSTNCTSRAAAGTYYDYIIAADTDHLKIKADASFAGTVDTVSVKEHGSVGVSESAIMQYTLPSNLFDSAGTLIWWGKFGYAEADSSTDSGIVSTQNAVSSLLYHDVSGNGVASHDGTTEAVDGLVFTADTLYKIIVRWPSSTGKFQVSTDTGSGISNGTEANFDDAFTTTGSKIYIGHTPFGNFSTREFSLYDRVLTDAEIDALGSP